VWTYVEGYRISDSSIVWGALIFWGILSGALIYVLNLLRPDNVAGLKVFSELGRVSFSLYLLHFPIFFGLSRSAKVWKITQIPEVNFILFEIVVIGLAYSFARLLFHFVEKPGMELGRVLIGRFSS
jgi:peptidoglycan/LPS O-acetylase OafA/YrhL